MRSCGIPLSSVHVHFIVPTLKPCVLLPPKPIIFFQLLVGGVIKSSKLLDMHAVHLLSIPIGTESVSNLNCFCNTRFCVV